MFSPASITALSHRLQLRRRTQHLRHRLHPRHSRPHPVVQLPPGLDSLGHTWVIITCAILFAVEFFVDKIPAFDLVWNLLHTFVRIPVAALVAYHASSQLTPQMQVVATALGASSHSPPTPPKQPSAPP